MKKLLLISLLLVTGCTTPETVLRNDKTGQVARCGGSANGSLAGGMIGYHIQKTNDEKCVVSHVQQGFSIKKIDGENYHHPSSAD